MGHPVQLCLSVLWHGDVCCRQCPRKFWVPKQIGTLQQALCCTRHLSEDLSLFSFYPSSSSYKSWPNLKSRLWLCVCVARGLVHLLFLSRSRIPFQVDIHVEVLWAAGCLVWMCVPWQTQASYSWNLVCLQKFPGDWIWNCHCFCRDMKELS